MRRSWTAILLASLACGESRDSVAPLTISPAGVNLAPGGRQQFTASEVVSWSVAGTDAGAIDSGGLYTAPAVSGTFQVVATSADKARIASATVTVSLGTAVSISIDPTNATLAPGAAQLFTTTVTGSQDRTVIWSVREPAGGAMADGLYTAPQRGGVFHVVAASHADPSKIAVATVAVGDPPARVSISIDPTAAALRAGESVRFFASVTGSADTSVEWTAPDGGSIDAQGLFVAPGDAGSYRVVASAHADPTKSATSVVTVEGAPQVTLSIHPQSVTLSPGEIIAFSATVTGSSNTAVQFSADPPGSIDANGSYTAPVTAGSWRVCAQSVADPNQRATATVTVVGTSSIGVTVDPAQYTISANEHSSIIIRARVSGTADQAVTWSVQEGASGGSVDAAGVYTAPANTEGTWHVVATSHADPSKSAISAITASWRDLHDHGGTVLASPKAYAIWWGDPSAWASDSKAGIEQVLGGLDGSSYLDILTQYMRGAKAGLEFAGSLADGAAPPPAADLYSTDVAAEVCKVLTDHRQQPEADALYLLFTSTAIDVAKVQACGWHSWGSCNDVKIAIALVPNSLGNERCSYPGVGACDAGITVATHTLASIAVHELTEMMTDPFATAWWDDSYPFMDEIGDACAWYVRECIPLAGHLWEIQSLWSNAAPHQCVSH